MMRNSLFHATSMLVALTLASGILAATTGITDAGAAPAPFVAAPTRTGLVVPAPKAGRSRPLIAVVADRDGAQTTDFIVP